MVLDLKGYEFQIPVCFQYGWNNISADTKICSFGTCLNIYFHIALTAQWSNPKKRGAPYDSNSSIKSIEFVSKAFIVPFGLDKRIGKPWLT